MTTWLTSDTHFNHSGIIKHCPGTRPYVDADHMNASLVWNWNTLVKPTDTIFVLGDFAYRTKDGWPLEDLFRMLNGHKHLVRGNHDERNPDVLKLPWESQSDLMTLRENGLRAVLCHYPLATWKGQHKGYAMLHGHSHGTLHERLEGRLDVGVDTPIGTGCPIRFGFAHREAWATGPFVPVDHHGTH